MSVFDVRVSVDEEGITDIVFSDLSPCGSQAFCILQASSSIIKICDDQDDYVLIRSKEHAKNLIKALEKSFELDWLK